MRPFNRPRFQTIGEFVALFTQICRVIHPPLFPRAIIQGWSHRASNSCISITWPIGTNRPLYCNNSSLTGFLRDCTANSIMLEPSGMYPKGFHPVKINRNRDFKGKATAYTRTLRPPRYYFIDFGLSRRYPTRDVTDIPLRGGGKTAPGHQSQGRSNPFHTDVYSIGNLIRVEFMRVRSQPDKPTYCFDLISTSLPSEISWFQFMEELIDAMTNEDPAQRPSIDEVIERFTVI